MKQYIAKMNYIYHHLLMITLSKYNWNKIKKKQISPNRKIA
jgi:uncharacterized membrane protein